MPQVSRLLAILSIPLATYASYIVFAGIGDVYSSLTVWGDSGSPAVAILMTVLVALSPMSILGVGMFLYREQPNLLVIPLIIHSVVCIMSVYLYLYAALVLIWLIVSRILPNKYKQRTTTA